MRIMCFYFLGCFVSYLLAPTVDCFLAIFSLSIFFHRLYDRFNIPLNLFFFPPSGSHIWYSDTMVWWGCKYRIES